MTPSEYARIQTLSGGVIVSQHRTLDPAAASFAQAVRRAVRQPGTVSEEFKKRARKGLRTRKKNVTSAAADAGRDRV